MSHEITIREDGTAEAAFSLQPAWHGLGTVLDHPMSSGEALKTAQLDWRVVQRPIAVGHPITGSIEWREEAGYLANVRQDNGLMMGMVTKQYKVIQNTEAFQFLDELVEGHEMRFESAFSLSGGRRVCILAQMPGVREVVKGDHLLKYVLLSFSHDGTEAVRFGPTAVRVVCANTYSLAVAQGRTHELAIRHTGDIKSKLSKARNILGVANESFTQYAEVSAKLAQHRLSKSDWIDYLDIMCPELNPLDPDYTERRADAIALTRMAIRACYRNERQATAPDTTWAAYNAVAEHIDHLPRRGASPGRKAEARFNVTMFGLGRNMKERAFRTACRFAGIQAA